MRIPAVLLSLLVLACTPGPAAVSSTLPPATTTVTTAVPPEAALSDFGTCMSDAGLDVGELALDSAGAVDLTSLAESTDVSTTEVRAALASCSVILWRAGLLTLSADPALQAAVLERLRLFAECMRAAGFVTFPDPDPDFTGSGPAFPVDSIPYAQPGFRETSGTCAATIPGGDSG